jgi:hypothetical protein
LAAPWWLRALTQHRALLQGTVLAYDFNAGASGFLFLYGYQQPASARFMRLVKMEEAASPAVDPDATVEQVLANSALKFDHVYKVVQGEYPTHLDVHSSATGPIYVLLDMGFGPEGLVVGGGPYMQRRSIWPRSLRCLRLALALLPPLCRSPHALSLALLV